MFHTADPEHSEAIVRFSLKNHNTVSRSGKLNMHMVEDLEGINGFQNYKLHPAVDLGIESLLQDQEVVIET